MGAVFIPDNTGGGAGILGITTKDEGVTVGTAGGITSIDFVGAGVTATGVGAAATVTIPGSGGAWGSGSVLWGNGEDGAAVLDGTNTYSFMSKSGNDYTLTRSVMLTNLTINVGCSLRPDSYALKINGTFTCNGTLSAAGYNAPTGDSGGGGGNAGVSTSGVYGTSVSGSNGPLNGAGTNGTGVSQGMGGNGGAGGSVGGTAGGTGGVVTYPTAAQGSNAVLYNTFWFETGCLATSATTPASIRGGASGASGAAVNGSVTWAGGGGGGGGVLVVFAHTIAGTGTFTAAGGNGGVAGTTNNTGGGGGGGGGVIGVVTRTTTYASTITLSVAGGTGGAGQGTGGAGSNGSAGRTLNWFVD